MCARKKWSVTEFEERLKENRSSVSENNEFEHLWQRICRSVL